MFETTPKKVRRSSNLSVKSERKRVSFAPDDKLSKIHVYEVYVDEPHVKSHDYRKGEKEEAKISQSYGPASLVDWRTPPCNFILTLSNLKLFRNQSKL